MKSSEKILEVTQKQSKKLPTKPISLVVGGGETGMSLYRVLLWKENNHTFVIDKGESVDVPHVTVMHICIPYSEKFVEIVKEYKKKYQPEYTVIHATVPIGTSKECDAFHSPVRGVHPVLDKSYWTFVKYFAPHNDFLKKYFTDAGFEVEEAKSQNDTEALKLLSTTYYGWNIIFEKMVHEFCEENGLDFDVVYTSSNETYNDGYEKMGMSHVKRPVLDHSDGAIGGHCVLPNLELFNFPANEFIKRQNTKFKDSAEVRELQDGTRKSRRSNDWRRRD